jgi:YVTN family beta-propeller protein
VAKKIILVTIASLAAIFLNSVNFIGCNSDSPTAPTQTMSFNRDIQPIFASNCNFPGCHNSTDKASGLDYSSWESIMINGSPLGAEIIPYNAFWSHTIHHINTDSTAALIDQPRMPISKPPYTYGNPLPRNLVQTLMAWINQGAKNDNGQVAYSDITRKAFVTNQAADLIAVVNLDNNFVVRMIKAGERSSNQPLASPHFLIADKQNRYLYLSLIAEGFLEKYDAVTYQKVGRMYAGLSPAHIVLNNAGTKGYFSDFDATLTEKNIKAFDTQTMTITSIIADPRMSTPHGLRMTHDESLLLVSTEGSEFLYVITTSTNQIEGDPYQIDPTVPPNGNGTQNFVPYQIAITNDDHYALVSCIKSNDVRVFDIPNRQFIQNIPVGLNPLAIDISPDGKWCYVPNRNSNSVTVIDLQTLTVATTIPSVGAQPHKVSFTQDGHYAYVTCESITGGFVHHPTTGSKKPGTTAVIDVWGGHVKIKNIEMASFPAGITIVPTPSN